MAAENTPRHLHRFRPGEVESAPDGRLFSPSYPSNSGPIVTIMSRLLEGRSGRALEVGSGTGQLICTLAAATPNISWTPSDPDPIHRASITAWIADTGAKVNSPAPLDAAGSWQSVRHLAPLQAVFAANVVHIAPWAVTEGIVAGAAQMLAPDGILAFYGPFREGGEHTGEGNREFDEGLRADNPEWGVRDLDEVAALAKKAGFGPVEINRAPSNNLIACFRRA